MFCEALLKEWDFAQIRLLWLYEGALRLVKRVNTVHLNELNLNVEKLLHSLLSVIKKLPG